MCPITTRRRTVDCVEFAELESGGRAYVTILARDHPHYEASPSGCCSTLRQRVQATLRFLRPGRNLSRWILGALALLVVSTTFVKLALMNRIRELHEPKIENEFLVLPAVVGGSWTAHNVVMENHGREKQMHNRNQSPVTLSLSLSLSLSLWLMPCLACAFCYALWLFLSLIFFFIFKLRISSVHRRIGNLKI